MIVLQRTATVCSTNAFSLQFYCRKLTASGVMSCNFVPFRVHTVFAGQCNITEGTLSDWTGQVKSANYGMPGNPAYPNDQDCFWLIIMAKGIKIRLEFNKSFVIEDPDQNGDCVYDYMEVRIVVLVSVDVMKVKCCIEQCS